MHSSEAWPEPVLVSWHSRHFSSPGITMYQRVLVHVGRVSCHPDSVLGGELPDSAQDLASFRGYRILHGTSLLGGRTRVTALAVGVLRPAPVS